MTRRTKRRYAHELYPHPDEFDIRPLATEVPYLYARAVGLETRGTSWGRATPGGTDFQTSVQRTAQLVDARRIALLADALHQGMTGDEAWTWALWRVWDYDGAVVWERARHYGVPVDQIKPYRCGPEPEMHDHYSEPDAHGWRTVIPIDCPESVCSECTEETEA